MKINLYVVLGLAGLALAAAVTALNAPCSMEEARSAQNSKVEIAPAVPALQPKIDPALSYAGAQPSPALGRFEALGRGLRAAALDQRGTLR